MFLFDYAVAVVIVADNESTDDFIRSAAPRVATTGNGSDASATRQWSSAKCKYRDVLVR